MSLSMQLPPTIQDRLTRLAGRVRWYRFLRTLSWTSVVLVLTAAVAFLADFYLGDRLPTSVRVGSLLFWLLLAGYFVRQLLRTVRSPIDPTTLAALIEQHHPELSERLITSVDLYQHPNQGNGSPVLIDLLVRETEHRAGITDDRTALSGRSTRFLVGMASVILVASLVPAAIAPDTFARLSQRFLMPWHADAIPLNYAITVTPGTTFAALGRPITIQVDLQELRPQAEPPRRVQLVLISPDKESRVDMTADPRHPGRYAASHRLAGDVLYRVEVAKEKSADYTLTAVTPVDLAPDSPTLTVTPPKYASTVLDAESYMGFVDLTALEHSQLTFEFAFNRQAQAAHLEWMPAGQGKMKQIHPLTLANDGLSATLQLPATSNGTYRLVMKAEHDITTEREGGMLSVKPDLPPALTKMAGKEGERSARPYDRVPMEIHLSDDIAVAGAELQYRLNDEEKIRTEKITLEGVNTRDAVGRHAFLLAGKVKKGDVVQYRYRFRDNLPASFKGPHIVHHPENGWLTLRIVDQDGSSLKEQEILAQRDANKRKLDEIEADIKQEKRRADRIRTESRGRDELAPAERDELRQLRLQNQGIEKNLRDLAQEMAKETTQTPLANNTRDLAQQEMRKADEALRQADQAKANSSQRDTQFREADQQLEKALTRLDQLRKENEQLTKSRLDQAKVESLADRQKQLAEQVAELEKDPAKEKQREELAQEQAEIEKKLRELTAESETLKKALDEARAELARQAADQAKDLADAQRELNRAVEDTEKADQTARLKDFARRQRELAARAEKLARLTDRPARSQFARPLSPEDAGKAADSLARGDAEKARAEQDRSARELDRLALALERAAELGKDPREQARQLARLEEDLARKTREEIARNDGKGVKELRAEQQAIREAAEKLSTPPDKAVPERKKALEQLAEAEKLLDKGRLKEAVAELEKAGKSLRELAGKMPSLDQRRESARQQLQRLKQEQERLARQADQGEKTEKNRSETAAKQEELAKELGKLDLPGQEAKKEDLRKNMEATAKDLREGSKKEKEATQGLNRSKNQLDDLAKAMDDKAANPQPKGTETTLPNKEQAEQARKLAQEQRELREGIRKAEDQARADRKTDSEKPNPVENLAKEQAEIAREANKLAKEVANQQGDKASPSKRAEDAGKSTNQAAKELQSGALPRAEKSGKQAEEDLRKLAGDLVKTPKGANAEGRPDILDQARKLTRRQEELNRKLEGMADETRNQRAQQQARQDDLNRQTTHLREQMERLGQSGQSPEMKAQARESARSAMQAENAMESARDLAKQGEQQAAQKQRDMAARALERAGEFARRAAGKGDRSQPLPQAGQAVQQAREQMNRAQNQLGNKQTGQARSAMEQAADALSKAAQQLAQAMNPNPRGGGPGPQGAPAGGFPDSKTMPNELLPYVGKSWGELPGEVRTKVVQQMRARYGEDYARLIKLYFEQIADTRKKK